MDDIAKLLEPAVGGVTQYALSAAWAVAEWESSTFGDKYVSNTVEVMAAMIEQVVDPIFVKIRALLEERDYDEVRALLGMDPLPNHEENDE